MATWKAQEWGQEQAEYVLKQRIDDIQLLHPLDKSETCPLGW